MARLVRRRRLFFTPLLVAIDMSIAAISVYAAYKMRYEPDSLFSLGFQADPEVSTPYLHLILFAPFGRFFSNSVCSVYSQGHQLRKRPGEMIDRVKSVCLGSVALMLMAFLYRGAFAYREFSFSRIVFGLDWLFNLFLVVAVYSLVRIVADELNRRGLFVRHLAIQGTGHAARHLARAIQRTPELQCSLEGFIADDPGSNSLVVESRPITYLGRSDEVRDIINAHGLEEIIVTDPAALGSNMVGFVNVCHKLDVIVELVPDLYGITFGASTINELGGLPVIQLNEISITGLRMILKRAEDITLSLAALFLTSPILLAAAICIRLDSPGSVIFRQKRIGKNGRHFGLIKLRSMCQTAEEQRQELEANNESDGILFKIRRDPRITRVGKIIRKTSIDELPQLLNVLKGEMSLVGPRPLPVLDVKGEELWKDARVSVAPGITGLWQVNRIEHTSEEMLKWDIYYIENWSLWLDFRILCKSVYVVLTGKDAY